MVSPGEVNIVTCWATGGSNFSRSRGLAHCRPAGGTVTVQDMQLFPCSPPPWSRRNLCQGELTRVYSFGAIFVLRVRSFLLQTWVLQYPWVFICPLWAWLWPYLVCGATFCGGCTTTFWSQSCGASMGTCTLSTGRRNRNRSRHAAVPLQSITRVRGIVP